MRDVDALLKETDDALRRIEGLKRAKGRSSLVPSARGGSSSQLLNVALAAGLVGLSMLRYHDNTTHRSAIGELERKVAVVSGRGESLARAVEVALQSGEVKGGTRWSRSWWGNSGGADELREALTTFRAGG